MPLGAMAADGQTEWGNGERLHLDSGQRREDQSGVMETAGVGNPLRLSSTQ